VCRILVTPINQFSLVENAVTVTSTKYGAEPSPEKSMKKLLLALNHHTDKPANEIWTGIEDDF